MSNTITRDQASPDTRALAMDLCPWPMSNEEAWAIIEDRLDKVRADSYAEGIGDAYEEAGQLAGEEKRMKHCGHTDHVNPYWDCEHCTALGSTYRFQLKGPGWTPNFSLCTDDLPRHDEVIAKKREMGLQTLRSSDVDS